MIDAHQLLFTACREAGRQAATGTKSVAEVQQVVLDYLERAGIDTTGMPLPTVVNLTSSSRPEPTDAEQLDRFRITATLPLANFRWSPVQYVTSNFNDLTVVVDWYSMRDKELTISQTIPVI